MSDFYQVTLRYFPGDLPLELEEAEIINLAKDYGLDLTIARAENHNFKEVGGKVVEETLGVSFEKITQTVISVVAEGSDEMQAFLHELFRRYQSPRPSFGLWGSNSQGETLAREIAAYYD